MENTLNKLVSQSNDFRLIVFASCLLLFLVLELLIPRVKWTASKLKRDLNNLALSFLNTFVLRIAFPVTALKLAQQGVSNNVGLLNFCDLNPLAHLVLTFFLLDLAIYAQHIAFHKVPILWRLHRVHHMDKDLDVTSGNRFHTIEMIISMIIKLTLIFALGLQPAGVILFTILLNASAMFNHSNIYIPNIIDKALQWVIVTPDMHRVHHSEIQKQTDSNYGFFFSIWDHIFKTYTNVGFENQHKIVIGLKEFKEEESISLPKLLTNPFKK